MSRRRNSGKPTEPAAPKAPVRVARRKRRKPPAARSAQTQQRRLSDDEAPMEDHAEAAAAPTLFKLSRAPRPAEPPPADPNVFSYTFTIWKSH